MKLRKAYFDTGNIIECQCSKKYFHKLIRIIRINGGGKVFFNAKGYRKNIQNQTGLPGNTYNK